MWRGFPVWLHTSIYIEHMITGGIRVGYESRSDSCVAFSRQIDLFFLPHFTIVIVANKARRIHITFISIGVWCSDNKICNFFFFWNQNNTILLIIFSYYYNSIVYHSSSFRPLKPPQRNSRHRHGNENTDTAHDGKVDRDIPGFGYIWRKDRRRRQDYRRMDAQTTPSSESRR